MLFRLWEACEELTHRARVPGHPARHQPVRVRARAQRAFMATTAERPSPPRPHTAVEERCDSVEE